MRNFLSLILVLAMSASRCLFSMPAPTDMGAPAMMPPPPDASAMPAPGMMPGAAPMEAPATSDVVPEQLGEFEVKEEQPGLVQKPDLAIINLVKKSNAISKQMKDIADDIAKIRDDILAKFALINNSLEDLYQKVGLESGEIKQLLTEEK